MFQKRGSKAEENFPNRKIAMPSNLQAQDYIVEKLLDLGLQLNVPVPEGEHPDFLYILNNKIGYNSDYATFTDADYKEMGIIELSQYERVPLKMTLTEISDVIGHDVKIIDETT